jgi:uncharacterized protein YggU (UPF0235/DUF167 family)
MSSSRSEAPLPALPPFASITAGALQVRVRVRPGARAARIQDFCAEADGSVRLGVAVTSPAERGRANAALLELLARSWQLPKSALRITAGAAGRRKTIEISGDPRQLVARLAAWHRQSPPARQAG